MQRLAVRRDTTKLNKLESRKILYFGLRDALPEGHVLALNTALGTLSYLSLDGLKKSCLDGEKTTYCTACSTGVYPTKLVDVEEIQPVVVDKR